MSMATSSDRVALIVAIVVLILIALLLYRRSLNAGGSRRFERLKQDIRSDRSYNPLPGNRYSSKYTRSVLEAFR